MPKPIVCIPVGGLWCHKTTSWSPKSTNKCFCFVSKQRHVQLETGMESGFPHDMCLWFFFHHTTWKLRYFMLGFRANRWTGKELATHAVLTKPQYIYSCASSIKRATHNNAFSGGKDCKYSLISSFFLFLGIYEIILIYYNIRSIKSTFSPASYCCILLTLYWVVLKFSLPISMSALAESNGIPAERQPYFWPEE